MTNQVAPAAAASAASFDALGNPVRLAILMQLQQPRALHEIRVESSSRTGLAGQPLSRQTVRVHLRRLLATGAVTCQEGKQNGRATPEYIANPASLYALAETCRELAAIRVQRSLHQPTIGAARFPQPPKHSPAVIVVKGVNEGRAFYLDCSAGESASWLVGRKRNAHVLMDFDPYVSAEHARILATEGGMELEDLPSSRNGTSLNFVVLAKGRRTKLRHGDLIGVGRSLLLFHARG